MDGQAWTMRSISSRDVICLGGFSIDPDARAYAVPAR
jgi:hypothetical protein